MIRAKVKTTGADKAMEVLRGLAGDMEQTASEIARRLADEGFNVAYEILANHIYKGETIESLEVIEEYPGRYVLTATSGAILFMEFGAGEGTAAVIHGRASLEWGLVLIRDRPMHLTRVDGGLRRATRTSLSLSARTGKLTDTATATRRICRFTRQAQGCATEF